MLGAIADGTTQISGFLNGADCLSTINCFEKMGIEININGDSVAVIGRGLHGLRKPDSVLFTGNSGTTTRLLAGLMSAQAFSLYHRRGCFHSTQTYEASTCSADTNGRANQQRFLPA